MVNQEKTFCLSVNIRSKQKSVVDAILHDCEHIRLKISNEPMYNKHFVGICFIWDYIQILEAKKYVTNF